MELINTFESKINMLHIELSKEQYSQYVTYYNMVVEKNKVMNLTGITEFDVAAQLLHVLAPDEDPLVPPHLLGDGLPDRLRIRKLSHCLVPP